jgi:1-aminocyclopropane-1-carboxylate deaminase
MESPSIIDSRSHQILLDGLMESGIQIFLKREDEIHPEISGNKWRKLKYNIEYMQEQGLKTLVTFGGAFSNHIAATAAAAEIFGLNAIGIIRGERLPVLNDTLSRAERQGMKLHFSPRTRYREDKPGIAQEIMGSEAYHLIPEGGSNELGVKGCEEILTEKEKEDFDIITVAAGTGATAAGILRSISSFDVDMRVYSALKGDFLEHEIIEFSGLSAGNSGFSITDDYSFGGYARTSPELFDFMTMFYNLNAVKLDPIYTSKMLFGLNEEIKLGLIKPNSKVLAIHTGGLQGIEGIEKRDKVSLFRN